MDLREASVVRRHPWEVVRSHFFRRLISRVQPQAQAVIDIGAGDGWFAAQLIDDLPSAASITCWDAHYTVDDLAAVVPTGILRTSTAPTEAAPLVLALDVLEHVEDDRAFVRDHIRPLVSDGGVLVVSVPAHQALFTNHDRALQHYRRYSPRVLRDRLSPQFDVVASGSLFTSLLVPRALSAALDRVRPRRTPVSRSRWTHGPALTMLVTTALRLDAALCAVMAHLPLRLPGLSIWAVATPRGGDHR